LHVHDLGFRRDTVSPMARCKWSIWIGAIKWPPYRPVFEKGQFQPAARKAASTGALVRIGAAPGTERRL
jgi:hypothetical protein